MHTHGGYTLALGDKILVFILKIKKKCFALFCEVYLYVCMRTVLFSSLS